MIPVISQQRFLIKLTVRFYPPIHLSILRWSKKAEMKCD